MIGITKKFNVILKEVKDLNVINLKIRTFYNKILNRNEIVIVLPGIGI